MTAQPPAQDTASGARGHLVLVVGPSGAGKDTLIDRARAALADRGIIFARRIVTRPADAGGEAHTPASEAEFEDQARRGEHALSWSAHGLRYAIPSVYLDDLAQGRVVVANVSRGSIAAAEDLGFPVTVLHVTASADVLAARIAARGRESLDEIRGRLAREAPLACRTAMLVDVVNNGTVDEAATQLIATLSAILSRSAGTAR